MADENNPTHDSQAQRSARKRYSRRSEYWDHFEQKAECKYCKAILCADPVRDGTSRMKKHYEETCPVRHPKPGRQHVLHGEQQVSTSSPSPSHLDRQMAATEDQLVRLIALHGYPPSVVEDAQFRRFAGTLCPDFEMPSRGDVEERCDALFDQEMRDLKDALGSTPGLVSLSVGEAETAMGRVVYMAAINEHFIDGEWNLHRRVIRVFKASDDEDMPSYDDISEIKNYYCGPLKCEQTISCWGLPLKVCSVLSNCCNLDLLRNMLHADNLATQYKLFCATDINGVFHSVARLLTCFREDFDYWLDAFQDLSLSQKKRRDISSRLSLNHPWTYDEWWYACYYALEILHDECSSEAAKIASLAGKATFEETELTESYRTTLGTAYRSIEAISSCSSPTSNLCLIELLKLKEKLDFEYTKACRRNESIEDYVEFTECLNNAKKDLEKFLSEKYLLLSIPFVLDPRFKLKYVGCFFKKANLAPDCSFEVRVTIRKVFMEYSNQANEMDVDSSLQAHPSLQVRDSTSQVINPSGQVQEQAHLSSQEFRTELDAYLQDETVPIEQQDFDILKWWKGNCHRYPTIARMARDFLAIPASPRPSSQQITEITNHLRRYA